MGIRAARPQSAARLYARLRCAKAAQCSIPIGEPAVGRDRAPGAQHAPRRPAAGDPQLQYAMLRGSSVYRLDYLLQHCHPDDTADIAANFTR